MQGSMKIILIGYDFKNLKLDNKTYLGQKEIERERKNNI
jgi:hypothetical protein